MTNTMEINSFKGKYFFLSNFYPGNGDTLERRYQASKTSDVIDQNWVLSAPTPGSAKRRGGPIGERGRKIIVKPRWDSIRIGVMYNLVKVKFNNPFLREQLLNTGDAKLVEGNWWNDIYWGVCNGIGENHLGKILMKVRDSLRGDDSGY